MQRGGRNWRKDDREWELAELRSAAVWAQLRVGVHAALGCRVEVLDNCTPRTVLGRIVRSLVMDAGNGRSTAVKTLMRIIDSHRNDPEDKGSDASAFLHAGIAWDWSENGKWLTVPEATPDESKSAAEATPAVPRPNQAACETQPLSRQQRRYLARLHAKENARTGPLPQAA